MKTLKWCARPGSDCSLGMAGYLDWSVTFKPWIGSVAGAISGGRPQKPDCEGLGLHRGNPVEDLRHASGTVGVFSWAAVLLDWPCFLRDTSLPPKAAWRFRMSAKMAFTSKLKRAESSSRARRTSATLGSSHMASFSH